MRKYVPAALAQARGRLGPASSALAPINFMGVVSWCPLYRDSFALHWGHQFCPLFRIEKRPFLGCWFCIKAALTTP